MITSKIKYLKTKGKELNILVKELAVKILINEINYIKEIEIEKEQIVYYLIILFISDLI